VDLQRPDLDLSRPQPANHGVSYRNPRDCDGTNRGRSNGDRRHR
jgi:hypothetical protein